MSELIFNTKSAKIPSRQGLPLSIQARIGKEVKSFFRGFFTVKHKHGNNIVPTQHASSILRTCLLEISYKMLCDVVVRWKPMDLFHSLLNIVKGLGRTERRSN